jgi:hypothetical protein
MADLYERAQIFNRNIKDKLTSLIPTRLINTRQLIDQTFASWGDEIGRGALPYKEPQRAYMWDITIRDPSRNGMELMNFYAKQTAIPPSMTENVKRWYAGTEYSYSGREISPRIFRITFWDNQDFDLYRFFHDWHSMMHSGEENFKVSPENYLGEIVVQMLDSHGQTKSERGGITNTILGGLSPTAGVFNGINKLTGQDLFTFVMKDAFPVEISEIALSYSDTAEVTFDVMFAYRTKTIETNI